MVEESGAGIRLADVAERAGVSRQGLYLHFGDRSGLLVALVDYMDTSQGWADSRSYIFGAASGVDSLRRWVETMSWYTAKIDRIAQTIEASQYRDEAMAAAWRDRMNGRQALILAMMERIAGEGRLSPGWTAPDAADVVYVFTMPGPWRELTRELGWTPDDYDSKVWKLLSESLLGPGD
jgi:AcrR family transcriptional regulator